MSPVSSMGKSNRFVHTQRWHCMTPKMLGNIAISWRWRLVWRGLYSQVRFCWTSNVLIRRPPWNALPSSLSSTWTVPPPKTWMSDAENCPWFLGKRKFSDHVPSSVCCWATWQMSFHETTFGIVLGEVSSSNQSKPRTPQVNVHVPAWDQEDLWINLLDVCPVSDKRWKLHGRGSRSLPASRFEDQSSPPAMLVWASRKRPV